MREVRPEPLTAEGFAPFGEVIEARGESLPINYGLTERFNDLAGIDCAADGGRAIVSLFRGRPLHPLVLKIFERHPLGSQAFMPLDDRPYLAAVAPAGDLDPAAIRVFRAAPRQGVNYRRGVWHHFLLPLQAGAEFLVIDRDGPRDNCDEVELAEADQVRVAL